MRDCIFDNYVMAPMATITFDAACPADRRDEFGVAAAKSLLDRAYQWLND